MKYIISESRLKSFIYGYLDKYYYPDYGWLSHDHYIDEINRWGFYDFEVNDSSAYRFFGSEKFRPSNSDEKLQPNTLLIFNHVSDKMKGWFGDAWVPIFVKWFEEHTGLKVNNIKRV